MVESVVLLGSVMKFPAIEGASRAILSGTSLLCYVFFCFSSFFCSGFIAFACDLTVIPLKQFGK